MDAAPRGQIVAWLLGCCGLIFLMVVVGGVTRLTHSGLSMTEWQPLVGAVPPLSDGQWNDVFARYRQTPEYLKVNLGMTLAEFKRIFWWEYSHRLLGRSIGAGFLVPLLYFLARRRIDAPLARRLAVIFALGGLQGGLGWYMVESGLIDDPHVSPYRLTAHLGLAFLIYAAILLSALELLAPRAVVPDVRTWTPPTLPGFQFLMAYRTSLHPYIRTFAAARAAVPDGIGWLGSQSLFRTRGAADVLGSSNHGLTWFAITA